MATKRSRPRIAGMLAVFSRATNIVRRLGRDTRGATAIEYAVMASLIGAAIAATVWNIGSAVKANWYDKIAAIFS
jgi:pilus assembly protein Flp/PilA